jgi:ATP-binding cassette subfamily F protein 3
MLQISNLTYRIGHRLLFEDASASIPGGHSVGLVGSNGAGKSTLLGLIEGRLSLDGGKIEITARARVGAVPQSAPTGSQSLRDFVLAADTERAALLEEAEIAHDPAHIDPERIAEIHNRLADIAAETAPTRAATILAGLGFDEAAQARPLDTFSGGWRMRVAIAALLFSKPDLLLLDEPSNHLDLEARLWLEGFLAAYRGTVLLVSHDRALLNTVVGSIVHLDGGRLVSYGGNYDSFEKERSQRLALAAAQYRRQLTQRKHMQAFVDRFRYKASKARQAQSRLKAIERMGALEPMCADADVVLEFPEPAELPSPLITLEAASAGYDETVVLQSLSLRIDMDDRIAVLGANGNGKTTLLRLLAGRLKPTIGTLHRSGKLKVGYFAQEQAEEFDLAETPAVHLSRLMGAAPPAKVRAYLGRFGFAQSKADIAIGKLSGGEKAKLLLAAICVHAPQLLLLDEPANHLDIDAREALVAGLNDYPGAVILVTHDPLLVELCADRLWLVEGGACEPFEGDLDDYRRRLIEARKGGSRNLSSARPPAASAKQRKQARRESAQARNRLSEHRQAVEAAEARVEVLSAERAAIQARLGEPGVYEGPTADLMALQKRHADLERVLGKAEANWLDAQANLEAASGAPGN